MQVPFRLKIRAAGRPVKAVMICGCSKRTCGPWHITNQGIFQCPDAECSPEWVQVRAKKPGFWCMMLTHLGPDAEIDLPSLPNHANPWWSLFVRPFGAASTKRVVIGVLDNEFRGISDDTKLPATSTGSVFNPLGHGEAIWRLLSEEGCHPPICAGVKITAVEIRKGKSGSLTNDVVDAIDKMVELQEVDIINLSHGTYKVKLEALRVVARHAARHGVLCVAAAGNEDRNRAAFPARYDEWIAVGALGSADRAPDGSLVRFQRNESVRQDAEGLDPRGRVVTVDGVGEIFHAPFSCYGSDIDVVAPGTNLIVWIDGAPGFDISGTSFAAPIVCGALASELSRDETFFGLPRNGQRTSYMRSVLKGMCRPVGLNKEYEGQGILWMGKRDPTAAPRLRTQGR